MKITKPTLVVDKKKVFHNIRRMKEKLVGTEGIRFRPHFKTHQSEEVGRWFGQLGVTQITVSSLSMASFFAQKGWGDITVGVLVNPHEINGINRLMKSVEQLKLNLLVDSVETTGMLDRQLKKSVDCWLKIDTGYHRTGISWSNRHEILKVADAIRNASVLTFKGILTHPGHSYGAGSVAEIKEVYHDSVNKLQYIRDFLLQAEFEEVEISYGDTPTCSVIEDFYGVDEIRPGNFVYYDVMQLALGVCSWEDLSAAVMCPVIGRYPQRKEVVVYGGAVHLSKESVLNAAGTKSYGLVAAPDETFQHWGPLMTETYVSSLSQEHGVIKTTAAHMENIKIGDILAVLPVHSCLAANLLI